MVIITEAAAAKFKEMTFDPNLLPRIEITAGGCNGFEKKFSFDNEKPYDVIIKLPNAAKVLIDDISYKMLENSTVDYKESVTGSFFSIDIPEAKSSCGCGFSFSL